MKDLHATRSKNKRNPHFIKYPWEQLSAERKEDLKFENTDDCLQVTQSQYENQATGTENDEADEHEENQGTEEVRQSESPTF